jgi:hypothetical protein
MSQSTIIQLSIDLSFAPKILLLINPVRDYLSGSHLVVTEDLSYNISLLTCVLEISLPQT